MEALISPAEAAKRIGVSHRMVRTWIHRANEPLPSVVVGDSGNHRRVIASQIDAWLIAEAARKANGR